ncbi:DUF3306 domain-containing protein [Guyparkeria sp.]|uniref:DUF3306 domain-containing protein n=1 Tax=Chromatiales TaxID=135613 RepID=UPI003970D943
MSGSGSRNRSDDGFLRRWARRKAEVRSNDATEDPEAASVDSVQPPGATASGLPEPAGSGDPPAPAEPELTDADMPALESLDQDSDYSPFLSRGVSAVLRQKALRQLFRQPKFNVETCLDDFQDDYLNFQPLGDIVTCDMRHQTAVEARRKAEREAENTAERAAQDAVTPASAAEPVPPAADDVAAADPDPSAGQDEDDRTRPEEPPRDGGAAA